MATICQSFHQIVNPTLQNANHRNDGFEWWCWRRPPLRVPWTARRSNQPILNQLSIFTGRTDAEAEAPVLWPLDAKSQFIGKAPDTGKDWGQKKGMTEDDMVRWHHWLNGHEFEQALGDSEGQGSLACCSPWGYKELDTTEQLNRIEHMITIKIIIFISQDMKTPTLMLNQPLGAFYLPLSQISWPQP